MAKRGRKPLPSNVVEMRGNPGRRPINQSEPEPEDVNDLAPPDFLDGFAKAKWEDLAPKLAHNRLLSDLDVDMLAQYCTAYDEWRAALSAIAQSSRVFKSKRNGYPIPNPYIAIKNSAEATMRVIAAEFGMSPSSRSRINVKPRSNAPPKGNDKKAQASRLFDAR